MNALRALRGGSGAAAACNAALSNGCQWLGIRGASQQGRWMGVITHQRGISSTAERSTVEASSSESGASPVVSSVTSSGQPKLKHKTPRKRASSMLAELRRIEHEKGLKMNEEKKIPDFRAGDSLEVKIVSHLTCKDVDTFRGIVLGIRRNGPDSRFTLADVFMGTPIKNDIPLYSPFVKSIKVLQRAHIHKGKKRVRRAKLNYLWDKRDPREFTITG